jgi:hypothetical protein
MRAPSIMQTDKVCFQTGRTDNLHLHHIYEGNGRRKISDENGFWVWLTAEWHNGDSRICVHSHPNEGLDLQLKQECQRVYESMGHTREEFRALIERSYL